MSTINYPRRYANLKSSQGVEIELSYVMDYKADPAQGSTWWKATGVSLNVEAPATLLTAHSHVTLVLINRAFIQRMYYSFEEVWQVPLIHNFTAEGLTGFNGGIGGRLDARLLPDRPGSNVFTDFFPQIALVCDGIWQIDPIQFGEQHNFNFTWILYP